MCRCGPLGLMNPAVSTCPAAGLLTPRLADIQLPHLNCLAGLQPAGQHAGGCVQLHVRVWPAGGASGCDLHPASAGGGGQAEAAKDCGSGAAVAAHLYSCCVFCSVFCLGFSSGFSAGSSPALWFDQPGSYVVTDLMRMGLAGRKYDVFMSFHHSLDCCSSAGID